MEEERENFFQVFEMCCNFFKLFLKLFLESNTVDVNDK